MIDPPSRQERDLGRAWMLALQSGDEAAFTRIVQHYGRRILSFFVRSGADRGRAEDLCQEVFLRVHQARDRYEPTARFTTWLHRIASRIAINEATRSRWRRAVSLDEVETDEGGGPWIAADADGPVRRLTDQERSEAVRLAIGSLPTQQRTALILNRFQGLSYEEVADALGLGIPAVKSLLYRAREGLRQRLAPDEREECDDS